MTTVTDFTSNPAGNPYFAKVATLMGKKSVLTDPELFTRIIEAEAAENPNDERIVPMLKYGNEYKLEDPDLEPAERLRLNRLYAEMMTNIYFWMPDEVPTAQLRDSRQKILVGAKHFVATRLIAVYQNLRKLDAPGEDLDRILKTLLTMMYPLTRTEVVDDEIFSRSRGRNVSHEETDRIQRSVFEKLSFDQDALERLILLCGERILGFIKTVETVRADHFPKAVLEDMRRKVAEAAREADPIGRIRRRLEARFVPTFTTAAGETVEITSIRTEQNGRIYFFRVDTMCDSAGDDCYALAERIGGFVRGCVPDDCLVDVQIYAARTEEQLLRYEA